MSVLLICHANTCRSVMAHVILERMLAERGLGDVPVRSAGVARFARDGMIASLDARIVLREIGIRLAEEDFVSTDLKRHLELLEGATIVVTMTLDQKQTVRELDGAGSRPLLTLRELAGESGDIADPVGLGEDVYRATRDEILRCLDKGFDRLLSLRVSTNGSA
ncbi:MAG TPA: low molecular weight protein arginine phosphatase [Methylomirabilota bacterium]|nr:low molecular weight protein arginine phosphatase [Methylomirabilota bacterium]